MNSNNLKNNIMQKLLQNGQIKQNIFSINIIEEMSALLTIGEIPAHILENKVNYSKCKIRTSSTSHWNCLVTHILFNDDYNFYNAIPLDGITANFASGVSNIYIPQAYIDLFLNRYFKNLPGYNQKNCIIKKGSKTKHILCLKNFLNFDGPSINFIINGYAYKIPFEDLFEGVFSDSYHQYRLFKVEFTETPNNEWYFGTVFLKQHEVVYDGEKMEIGFYSGFKYDFTKFTNENIELYCWYDTLSVVFWGWIVFVPMGYLFWQRKMNSEYLVGLAKKTYKKNKLGWIKFLKV